MGNILKFLLRLLSRLSPSNIHGQFCVGLGREQCRICSSDLLCRWFRRGLRIVILVSSSGSGFVASFAPIADHEVPNSSLYIGSCIRHTHLRSQLQVSSELYPQTFSKVW